MADLIGGGDIVSEELTEDLCFFCHRPQYEHDFIRGDLVTVYCLDSPSGEFIEA